MAKSNTESIQFDLITQDKVLLSTKVNKLVGVSETGEFGILPKHADMLCKLDIAPLKYWENGKEEIAAVVNGVLEVKDNKVTVITDYAELGADIDEVQANKAAEKAQSELEMLKEVDTHESKLTLAEYRLRREMMRLRVAVLRKKLV